MSKRKHKTLTLAQKFEIIQKLDNGRSPVQLVAEYGVGRSTITDIKKKKNKIVEYMNSHQQRTTHQTLKAAKHPKVETALYTWFLQQRTKNVNISGEILQEKAKFFYKQITGLDDFAASSGWLDNFKKRFKIRQLTVTGEKLSSNFAAVEPFQKLFLNKVRELNLGPEQVYNADESGLFWRALPKKTLVHKDEDSAPGRKVSKDRFTFMPCANASGSHKLKLFTIGKAANPRALKDCRNKLPVIYKHQSAAWMNQELFKQWFQEDFVPSVQAQLKKNGLPPRALLLLDNAPSHPEEKELRSPDGLICVLYLPPNCTPLLQPMDQHVIQSIKLHYRKQLLLHLIADGTEPAEALKCFNLKNAIFNLYTAWEHVSPALIKKSWEKLWPQNVRENSDDEYEDEDLMPLAKVRRREISREKEFEEMTVLMNAISTGQTLATDEVIEWALGDTAENEQITFSDEDLVNAAVSDNSDIPEDAEEDENFAVVSHGEAVRCFSACIQWATENGVSSPELLILRQLQERAVNLRFKTQKQTAITDFFSP